MHVCLSNYSKGKDLLDLYFTSEPVRFGSGFPFPSHRLDSAHKHSFCTVICNLYQTTHLSENGGHISPTFPTLPVLTPGAAGEPQPVALPVGRSDASALV